MRDEIAAFGGDPGPGNGARPVAGAGAIAALLVMLAAQGLFAGAIAQSVPGSFFTPALARDISAQLVAPLGLEPTAAALADVPPQRLLDAVTDLNRHMSTFDRWGPVARSLTPFSPVVNGEVLPTDPWTGLGAGAARDVPLLVGHNRGEWRLMLAAAGQLGAITDAMATTAMQRFGPGPDPVARMRAAYPDASAEELLVLAHSDHAFRMPSLHLAAAHTAGGGRSYLYELTWPAPASGGALGACHFLEVPLVFGVLDRGLPRPAERHPTPARSPRAIRADADGLDRVRPRRPPRLARPRRPAPVNPGLRQRRPRRREALPGDHLVADDDQPGPPVRRLRVTDRRGGPAEDLFEQPERVLQIETAQERLPQPVHVMRQRPGP